MKAKDRGADKHVVVVLLTRGRRSSPRAEIALGAGDEVTRTSPMTPASSGISSCAASAFPPREARGEGRKSARGRCVLDDAVRRSLPRAKCVLGRGRADVDVGDDPWPAAVFLFVVRSIERIGSATQLRLPWYTRCRVTPRGEDPLDTAGTACPGAPSDDERLGMTPREGRSFSEKINRPGVQAAHGLSNVDEVSASRCHVGATS